MTPGRPAWHRLLVLALGALMLGAPGLVASVARATAAPLPAGVGVGAAATPGGGVSAARRVLPVPERLAAADRYAQAALASRSLGFTHSELVYVASGEAFPDALTAASVAATRDAPLLLTMARSVPVSTATELNRLAPDVIVVVGGERTVSDEVMDQLSRASAGSTVIRLAGADRFEVSRALIGDGAVGAPASSRIHLAGGASFPDALTAAPAASSSGSPVLLVDGSEPRATDAELALLDARGVVQVDVVGGTSSVSAELEAALATTRTLRRVSGPDRYSTGVRINQLAFRTATTAYLASGMSFPDALSGGPLAAHDRAPLYVVQQNCVPQAVLDDLIRLHPTRIVVLGGPLTLTSAVEALTPCP